MAEYNQQSYNDLLRLVAQSRAQMQQTAQTSMPNAATGSLAALGAGNIGLGSLSAGNLGNLGAGGNPLAAAGAGTANLMSFLSSLNRPDIKPTSSGIIVLGNMLQRYQAAKAHSGLAGHENIGYTPNLGKKEHMGMASGGSTVTHTLLLSSKYRGKIIGRGGDTMRQIEQQSGARVQFMAEREDYPGKRELKITGHLHQVESAKTAIMGLIGGDAVPFDSNKRAITTGRPMAHGQMGSDDGWPAIAGEHKSTFRVPNSSVGVVIGRGGEKVKEIEKKSGARVNISPENEIINGYRPINLYGSEASITIGWKLIREAAGMNAT